MMYQPMRRHFSVLFQILPHSPVRQPPIIVLQGTKEDVSTVSHGEKSKIQPHLCKAEADPISYSLAMQHTEIIAKATLQRERVASFHMKNAVRMFIC